KTINLYIHIPYCKARCRFCNFFLVAGRTPHLPAYFKALQKELLGYKRKLKNYPPRDPKDKIKTIYFGGGTPSLVDANLISDLIKFIKQNFEVEKNAEISIETNPENITKEKLEIYRKSGINRISTGLQAWQDSILKYLGRLYTIEEFLNSYKIIQESK